MFWTKDLIRHGARIWFQKAQDKRKRAISNCISKGDYGAVY
jgi:hypothetical protein